MIFDRNIIDSNTNLQKVNFTRMKTTEQQLINKER